MSSKKLLSQRQVIFLINSVFKADQSKSQICTSLGRQNQLTSHTNSQNASHQAVRTHTTQANRRGLSEQRPSPQLTCVRLASSSSTSSVNLTSTSLKRDASTQAQQQEVPEPQVTNSLNDGKKYEHSFSSSDLSVVRCLPSELSPKPSTDKLLFGQAFTDHMFRVDWDSQKGWSRPLISKVHNLNIHPAAKVLHYAIEAFEGAKAYRGHDNKIRFFRLDQNIRRLLNSARRLALPEFSETELMKCIHQLVQLEQDWIPVSSGQQQLTSLYIRPTILGVEPSLGVANSGKALLYVLLSPVGPYFKTGFKPISLYADPDFIRAWPGGAGNSKLGANYAPTIIIQKQAEKMGLQQVLWLFGDDMKLTEVGTMNIFLSLRNRETGKIHLVTPPLDDGLILPGITRASILDLARQWPDVVCEERYVTISELKQLVAEDKVIEMFGAGTACIVCPISSIQMKNGANIKIPFCDITNTQESSSNDNNEILTKRILKSITDIQYGKIPHPWAQELNAH